MPRKKLVAAAFEVVYDDIEAYIKDIAKEHTVANMGQSLTDFTWSVNRDPKYIIADGYHGLLQQCESDEMADGIEEEYRSWLKDARRDALLVQKAGLPLTIRNSRDAFEGKGIFAKKTKKK